jgi:hypothetical protein
VEVRFDQYGHIYKTIKHRGYYPLTTHACTANCGYHSSYYTTYYPKYHHTHYYAPMHTTNIHVNTPNGHKTTHNYYTNVYVDQQKKQPKYTGNSKGNHNSHSNVNNNSRTQQRTNTTIHRPQSVVVRNVAQPAQQKNSSSNRIEGNNTQVRSTRQLNATNGSSRTTTNRNERGSRNR